MLNARPLRGEFGHWSVSMGVSPAILRKVLYGATLEDLMEEALARFDRTTERRTSDTEEVLAARTQKERREREKVLIEDLADRAKDGYHLTRDCVEAAQADLPMSEREAASALPESAVTRTTEDSNTPVRVAVHYSGTTKRHASTLRALGLTPGKYVFTEGGLVFWVWYGEISYKTWFWLTGLAAVQNWKLELPTEPMRHVE